ncbi:hypothetical protein DFH06DRAFT_90467 [Mycena polygramma]|nr:hypothetical protein DFH06DRAFT_90467 [Mycena polygramma]
MEYTTGGGTGGPSTGGRVAEGPGKPEDCRGRKFIDRFRQKLEDTVVRAVSYERRRGAETQLAGGNRSCIRGSARAGTAEGRQWKKVVVVKRSAAGERGYPTRSSCVAALPSPPSSSSSHCQRPLAAPDNVSNTPARFSERDATADSSFGSSPRASSAHFRSTDEAEIHDVPGLAPSSMLPRASLSPKPPNAAHHDSHSRSRRPPHSVADLGRCSSTPPPSAAPLLSAETSSPRTFRSLR